MDAFVRESVAQDSDEDQDRITLSLGILDEQLSEEEEYSENPSPTKRDRKSSTQRSPTPRSTTPRRSPTPRRSVRASTRASTRGSERLQACTSRTATPPRTRTSSRRARRRSPSYSPPRVVRVSSPEERVGNKHTIKLETHRITKYQTGEGTHRTNITFNPRLAPPRRREGLTPSQQSFLSKQQGISVANWGNPESQIISVFNAPPSLQISIMNYQIHK